MIFRLRRFTLDEHLAYLVRVMSPPRVILHRSDLPDEEATIPPEPVRLRLVPASPGLLGEHRRADCTGLDACETAWARVHGEAAAACPAGCTAYQRRDR